MINVTELTDSEIFELDNLIKCEIFKRKQLKIKIRKNELKKIDELNEYGNSLVKFIEKEVNHKVVVRNRKQMLTNERFVLFKHLRSKGMYLKKIGHLFRCDHATVMYGIRQFNNLKDTNDTFFMIQYEKISQLIERFDSEYSTNKTLTQ